VQVFGLIVEYAALPGFGQFAAVGEHSADLAAPQSRHHHTHHLMLFGITIMDHQITDLPRLAIRAMDRSHDRNHRERSRSTFPHVSQMRDSLK